MDIKAKKSLGQNFLIDRNIIEKITSFIDIKNQNILEVGPGTGNLTESILDKDITKLTVVEKDRDLSKFLEQKFKNKVNVINDDILKINPNKISDKKIIVFGNLPYNVSTEILIHWIKNINHDPWFSNLILMFQKEVADRIIADVNSSQYGRLTILSQWRLNINKMFDLNPSCFKPTPKIFSSVLHFTPKKNYFEFKKIKNLEIVTKTFFNQRRKMIKNPLKQLFENYNEIAENLNLNLNDRPQNLCLNKFFQITKIYEKLRS